MRQIEVALGTRSYPIVLGEGLLADAASRLAPFARNRRLLLVSDRNVWAAHGEALSASLAAAGIAPALFLLPPGEAGKSWEQLIALTDFLLAQEAERGDHVVAFGGGVVGDAAGFAAAIVKRGCPYVQIPTTLLAQVDSSIGGKTAINAGAGKNLIGAFHQPAAVLIDPAVLSTLPDRQMRAGYAEIVKYGLIADPDFFAWCEDNHEGLLAREPDALLHAIETSVRAKAAIVAEDERETKGRRALLNLGHTFGHALEAETGFSDRLLHGEAVALGMALAFRFSALRGLCTAAEAERVGVHLAAAGLPVRLSEAGVDASGERLALHMAQDKKRSGGRLPFILARGIGQAFVDEHVAIEEVAAFLDRERSPQAAA